MAPRAFWTGNLRLSLVNIPVRLYPATSTERKIELVRGYLAARGGEPT